MCVVLARVWWWRKTETKSFFLLSLSLSDQKLPLSSPSLSLFVTFSINLCAVSPKRFVMAAVNSKRRKNKATDVSLSFL